MKRKLSLLMLLTMLSMVGYAAGLKTYPAPDGAPLNDDFT